MRPVYGVCGAFTVTASLLQKEPKMPLFKKQVCAIRRSEAGCSMCSIRGIVEGTYVHVESGWQPVETLDHLDRWAVLSGGYRPATRLSSHEVWQDTRDCPSVARPLIVPQGALGNDEHLWMQQDTRVILQSAPFSDLVGTTHVSLRAGDLIGERGIELADTPPTRAFIYRVFFDEIDAVQIAGGLWQMCAPTCNNLNLFSMGDYDQCRIGRHVVRHLTRDEALMFLLAQDAAGTHDITHGIRHTFA